MCNSDLAISLVFRRFGEFYFVHQTISLWEARGVGTRLIETTISWDEAARVIDTPIMVAGVNGGETVLKNYPTNRFITVPW